MDSVSIYEAKTHLSRLVARAEAGEETIVTRNGRPVARIVPIATGTEPRVPGAWKGKVWIADDFDDFTEQDERDWYGE